MTDKNEPEAPLDFTPKPEPMRSFRLEKAQPSSSNATLSLVFGIISWVMCGIMTSIPAIIWGHLAMRDFQRNPCLGGRGQAIAGLILGYVHTALWLVMMGFIAIFLLSMPWDEVRSGMSASPALVNLETQDASEAEFHLILPEGHDPAEPIAAAIWLHGYGWNPSELAIFEEEYQKIADDLGIAFIGISASSKMEEGSYEWLEDTFDDYYYLSSVLEYHADAVTLDWPRVALFGFSQGAKVAGDLASHFPDEFRGAILMSPGGQREADVSVDPLPENEDQYYVCVVGADEAIGNVQLTRRYARKLERLGAEVFLKEYEGVEDHSTPPDYYERLPEWLSRILFSETDSEPESESESEPEPTPEN